MNQELRDKCLLPTVNNSRLHLLVNQSLKWQQQLCQNSNSDPDITSILVDYSCWPQNAAQGQVHVANEFSSIRRSGSCFGFVVKPGSCVGFVVNQELFWFCGETRRIKNSWLIVGNRNERAKALDILNEELKVFKPSDGELFSEMTNLLMIENISLKWQHQLCQNPNSDPDITSILVDHSCGPQNAAEGQVHVANEFSSIRRSGGLQLKSNFFMMARLPEGLCPKLVAGMIGETVSIAAKIKNTKLTTAKEELET
ncbi:protein TOPLESS [Artemisia annua]|uniref:Protein TOPLESS n=1 Tax=Artemisia annua TaxID=35608 RepID=A0A2U1Q2I7_ARTAN|nr:protein TOPLESS [Artemisia annua]